MIQNRIKISKYLCFILRHHPEAIGLGLDSEGWASIDEIIQKISRFKLTPELIDYVMQTDDKQRFCISEDGTKIRANQGHSIDVNLNLKPLQPPEVLLHGTANRFLENILEKGLLKQKRQFIHLTESESIAKAVGSRYGKPVILEITSVRMVEDGFIFYKSLNNVWLVEHVPVDYLKILF